MPFNQTNRPPAPVAHHDSPTHRRLLAERANASLPKDGTEPATAPVLLKPYTVATLPNAALYPGGVIQVSDEAGGTVPAVSDGSNWRRITDRAVVS